jgi:hypothetical protein
MTQPAYEVSRERESRLAAGAFEGSKLLTNFRELNMSRKFENRKENHTQPVSMSPWRAEPATPSSGGRPRRRGAQGSTQEDFRDLL